MKQIAIVIACLATPAAAMDDLEALQLSAALGSILAAEEPCGLTYDQTAISAYITTNVPPERMDFAQSVQMQVMGQTYMLKDMKGAIKAAHCTSISQTARHYGFIK